MATKSKCSSEQATTSNGVGARIQSTREVLKRSHEDGRDYLAMNVLIIFAERLDMAKPARRVRV